MTTAIQRRDSTRPSLLVFEISGKITKADVEDMAAQVDQAFETYDKIDILLIISDFEGLEPGALFDRKALNAQLRSVRHVGKYGVVGAPDWIRAMIDFSDLLSPVDSKTFDLAEEEIARAWIDSGSER